MMKTWLAATCPACGHRLRCRLLWRGRRIRCPHCRAVGRVPVNTDVVLEADPDELKAACEKAVTVLSALLRAAGRRVSALALAELVRQLPRSGEEAKAIPPDCLLSRCIGSAWRDEAWKAGGLGAFREFVRGVMAMRPERRRLLEAAVVGSLLGLNA